MTPEEIANDCLVAARDDKAEVGLWWIAQDVAELMGKTNFEENKAVSMGIVLTLMANNVMPGNLGNKPGGFLFWQGTTNELLARIEESWSKGRIPNLGDDGCWFCYRKPKTS